MFRPSSSSFAVSVLVVLLLTTTQLQFANAQCSVCGEGFQVTIPEAIFEFPNQPIIDCGTLEMAGETGLIPTDQCVFLPDLLTMCGCSSTSIMTGEDDEEETPVPAPDTPVPETPVPETPVPETPVPETPVPETPVPETPVPETPVPETPVPETPVPETPVPETPVPETPVPETPVPETFVPETPVPETPVPDTPVPETPVPETPVPAPETDVPVPDTPVPVPETPVPVPDTPVPAPDTQVPVPDDDDDGDSDESKDSDDDDDDREEMATTTTTTTNPQEDLSTALLSGGFYCGYQLEDSIENCAQPCRTNDDCASTEGQSCWGSWNYCATDPSNPVEVESPQHTAQTPPTNIPEALVARSDSRCGVTEVDARSNCGTPCLTVNDCPNPDDFCWTTHTHYCHLKPSPHPECLWERAEQYVRRCGGDEEAARSFCGTSCSDHTDCASDRGEYCFPVQLNLCDCFEEQDEIYNALLLEGSSTTDQKLLNVLTDGQNRRTNTNNENIQMMTNRQYFDQAKEPLVPYFLQAYQEVEEEAERNKNGLVSSTSSSSSTTTRMVAFLMMMMVVPMVL